MADDQKLIYAWIKDGKVKLQFGRDPDFITALKDSIPWQSRKWNGKQRKNSRGEWEDNPGGDNTWIVDVSHLHVLEALVEEHGYELRLPNSGEVVQGPPPIDIYQNLLGLLPFKDLHAVYKQLALRYHPDRYSGDPAIFTSIQAAWTRMKEMHQNGELP